MGNSSMNGDTYKPILRWAGGKNWLLKDLHRFAPNNYNNYHEPFLGGGSVFFHLKPKGRAYLSDTNQDLINAFCQIRDNVEEVISHLEKYENTKEEYYRVRDTKYRTLTKKAAQFIYLNRTCFNGIYRVNLKGKYNVPYGFKQYKELFEFERYRAASEQLQKVSIQCFDFEESLKNVGEGDLVFLDPPYIVNHENNGFVKYNEKLFSWEDQKRLASYITQIKEKGAFYILTNARHKSIRELFGDLDKPHSILRASVIGGRNAERGQIGEYIFTNSKLL